MLIPGVGRQLFPALLIFGRVDGELRKREGDRPVVKTCLIVFDC